MATWPAETKVRPREGGQVLERGSRSTFDTAWRGICLATWASDTEIGPQEGGQVFERGSGSTFDTTWRGIVCNLARRSESRSSGGRTGFTARQQEDL